MFNTRLLPASAALLLAFAMSANAASPSPLPAGDPDDGFQGAAPSISIRQQVQDQLTKAGYTNVTVLPSSFYIHATNKAGEPVAMILGPDSLTTVTEVPTKGGAAARSGTSTPPAK